MYTNNFILYRHCVRWDSNIKKGRFVNGYLGRHDMTEAYKDVLGTDPDNIIMGFELECTNRKFTYPLGEYDFLPEWVYIKDDPTVGEIGMEIVSIPMSLDYIKSQYESNRKWTNRMALLGFGMMKHKFSSGVCSHNTGLHIHISEQGFYGEDHMRNLAKFINLNDKFFERVSRRKVFYSSFKPREIGCFDGYIRKNSPKTRFGNIGGKSNTLELRFFNGIMSARWLQVAMEISHSLVQYTRNKELNDLTVSDYIQFLCDNKDKYNSSYKFIKGLK